jgi:hypothetical protein
MADTIAPFAPEAVPHGLKGLTAELVADLYDCCAKFGKDVVGASGLRRLTLKDDPPIFISVCVPPSPYRHVMVSAIPGGVPPDAHAVPLGADGGLNASLRWDRAVAVSAVRRGIAARDARMREAGGFDAAGRRVRVASDDLSADRLPVDRVLAERGKRLAVIGCRDPDAARAMFDRPEDVVAVGMAPEGVVVCHRRDAVRADDYERAVRAVLARRGIARHEQVERMSGAELRELMAEIDEELLKPPE